MIRYLMHNLGFHWWSKWKQKVTGRGVFVPKFNHIRFCHICGVNQEKK